MKIKSVVKKIFWIFHVSKRYSRVDREGRSAVTSFLATLGLCFGVMTLIVVMSVMNGFQMSFIDSILEISSSHVRVSDLSEQNEQALLNMSRNLKNIRYISPFYEAQALVTGKKGGANTVLIRSVDENIFLEDYGFYKEIKMLSGSFDLSQNNSIILGSSLARIMGVKVGDEVNLLVMSGGSDVDLFSSDRKFKITGIFSCGYQEINSSYGFVNYQAAKDYFGTDCKKIWGIKLDNYNQDAKTVSIIRKQLGISTVSSWREYNKTFFGTLRVEKNILLLLVALIFVVVTINIYNGMRRLVFERKGEIAILSALGARNLEIKAIFTVRGFLTGLLGSLTGLLLGLLISHNTDVVFNMASKIMYFFQYIFTAVTDKANLIYVQENSSYSIYARIPARVFPGEVLAITMFGILSPLLAAFAASKNVLKMTVAEVLHDE